MLLVIYFSYMQVSQVSFNTVQTQEAYLLFYIKDDEYVKHSNVPSSFTSEVY